MVRDKTAARERAALDLARTTVRAPVDGVVVNLRVQQGEQVKAATPLFALVVVSRPWVEANFKETELTHVRVGQKATVVLDTYPDTTWEAVVESLSPATGAEFAILPPQNASGQLGQGRAAPAGEAAPAAAGRRAAAARRHDRDGEDRHRPPAPCRRRGADRERAQRRSGGEGAEVEVLRSDRDGSGACRAPHKLMLAGPALSQSIQSLSGRKLPSSTPISSAIRAFSLAFIAAIRSRLASKS